MTHDDALDLVPLHALGLLEADDRAALESHLAMCAACRAAFDAERHAVDALAHAPAQVRPRPALRTRVLEAAAGGRYAAESGASRPQETPAPSHVAVGDSSQGRPVVARMWWVAGAAAAVALIASAGLWQSRAELSALRDELATVRANLVEARTQTQLAVSEVRVQQQALDVVGASDLVRVDLRGEAAAAAARAQALYSPSHQTLVLSASDLPALPSDRIYQLWAIVDGQPVSAGLFAPDTGGRGRLITRAAFDGMPAALAVTLEPAGGVPQPTGPRLLVGVPIG